MKNKKKLALGLLATAATVIGLSGCSDVSEMSGVVLQYVDESGITHDYTAEELLQSYEEGSSAASTNFDKVYEVLIRKYYADQPTILKDIDKVAENDVNSIKAKAQENADSNGTTYEAEIEKLLDSNGVDNIDELFRLKEYQEEKSRFENQFYSDYITEIRDGNGSTEKTKIFTPVQSASEELPQGYIKDEMPYHVSHVLVKIDASSSATNGQISKDNATKIATVIAELAGAKVTKTEGESTTVDMKTSLGKDRLSFGDIAFSSLNDDTSKKDYGDLGIMHKVMDKATSFVPEFKLPEFKLGVYAYDALYNKTTSTYRTANKATLLPDEDTTYNQGEEKVQTFFENLGIGTIPYGAAVALLKTADNTALRTDGYTVNDGDETFYPRNIIFNKYFNKRNVCVITPNEIPYNNGAYNENNIIAGSNDKGTYDEDYAKLPGFNNEAANKAVGQQVLSDSKGRVVLAVRADSSGYQGINFIVIDRSALEEYANADEPSEIISSVTSEEYKSENITSLSDYYTVYYAGENDYPNYTVDGKSVAKTTYNNFIKRDTSELISRRDSLKEKITGYNDDMSTYIFTYLINTQSIKYAEGAEWLEKQMDAYIETKRADSARSISKDFNEDWADYAEALAYQQEERAKGDKTGMGPMISETCAIGYTSDDAAHKNGLWVKGGACGVNN